MNERGQRGNVESPCWGKLGRGKQATGEAHSVDQVILEHVETVKNMREVMAISFNRITGQGIENAMLIANSTDQDG
ncbi:hypothetical protein [Nocardia asiatica]|uniref:hypothetical protein n=1 Tax=Nocardia asiatica TaxID=209252 RepID=UPI0024568D17|nr:hypothetical protein [Nocardia asiatica]